MYAYLEGKLADKHPTKIILDVSGVGYELLIPLSTFGSLPQLGGSVKLWVHYHIKEYAHELYGFLTLEEKDLFEQLISISGFGPKSAVSILSSVSIPLFVGAINSLDTDTLISIPGIGAKTAQRLILELKGKLVLREEPETTPRVTHSRKIKDAVDALVSLGYNLPKARKAVDKAVTSLAEEASTEEIIRETLRKGEN